jgi:hypothetical protein
MDVVVGWGPIFPAAPVARMVTARAEQRQPEAAAAWQVGLERVASAMAQQAGPEQQAARAAAAPLEQAQPEQAAQEAAPRVGPEPAEPEQAARAAPQLGGALAEAQ